MTLPKPYSFKVKRGRKTKSERARQIAMLRMLAQTDDLTAWQACLSAGCGYDFALEHFRDGRYFLRMAMTRRDKNQHDPDGFPTDYSHRLNNLLYSA